MKKEAFCLQLMCWVAAFSFILFFNTIVDAQNDRQPAKDAAQLYEEFKAAKKAPCGERDEAIRLGSKIIEYFADDEVNFKVIEFVKAQIPTIEKDDLKCRLYEQFNGSFRTKNWSEFFTASKKLLEFEDKPTTALRASMISALVGYELSLKGDKKYFADAVFFARKAIELIETGVGYSWVGTGEFKTCEEALLKMNEIIASPNTKN